MNELIIEAVGLIPAVRRHEIAAVSHTLREMAPSPWDGNLWHLAYWYREA